MPQVIFLAKPAIYLKKLDITLYNHVGITLVGRKESKPQMFVQVYGAKSKNRMRMGYNL